MNLTCMPTHWEAKTFMDKTTENSGFVMFCPSYFAREQSMKDSTFFLFSKRFLAPDY